MRTLITYWLTALLLVVLTACGGGGDSTSIKLSTSAIQLEGVQGEYGDSEIVSVSYQGDGVIAGYPPNVPEAYWLSIETVKDVKGQADFRINLSPYTTAGAYQTTLRFVTGHADGSDLKYLDVKVTANVGTPFTVTNTPMTFVRLRGTSTVLPATGFSLQVQGSRSTWTATADASWLKVTPASGTGAATVQVTATMDASATDGDAFIRFKTSSTSAEQVRKVSLSSRAAQLVASPTTLSFTIDTNTTTADLQQALQITDELQGSLSAQNLAWTLKSSSANWLTLSQPTGNSAPATTVQVQLDPTVMATLPIGTYAEQFTLGYTDVDGIERELSIPVNVKVTSPSLSYVGPQVGQAGQAGELIVRGSGFQQTPALTQIKLGGQLVNIKAIESDTQLRLEYPALAAGTYPLTFVSNSPLNRSTASFTLVDAQPLTTQFVSTGTQYKKLVHDPRHHRLYALDAAQTMIDEFDVSGNSVALLKSHAAAGVKDIALSADTEALYQITAQELQRVDLTASTWTATTLTRIEPGYCSIQFKTLAVTNNNDAVMSTEYWACSGYSDIYRYQANTRQTTNVGSQYQGRVITSRDGSRILVSGSGLSPGAYAYLIDTESFSTLPYNYSLNAPASAISGKPNRILLNHNQVLSGQLIAQGLLEPSNVPWLAVLSEDGSKAFAVGQTSMMSATSTVTVYDLTKRDASNQFVKSAQLSLPTALYSDGAYGYYHPDVITRRFDDRVLFIAAETGLQVVALP